uniref:RRM domain-containing protein n=1 Tax=Clastoptera arizonana TaxID=38151 RepID=A0A1B6E583_9HEMI
MSSHNPLRKPYYLYIFYNLAKKPTSGINSSCNLWISGLSSITRASDLKQIFSKFGKVVGAKVVTNARTPGARCYGFVTMTCSEDASKAMGNSHLTELHGRIISVVKATNDSAGPPKRNTEAKRNERPSPKKVEEKKKEQTTIRNKQDEKEDKIVPPGTEDFEKMEPAAPGTENEISVEGESKDKEIHSSRSSVRSENHPDGKRARSRTSSHRSFEKHRRTSPNVLTFSKIKEERDKQRMREKERMIREEDRRRDNQRQRDAERKQREESMSIRLDRERQRLKMEREKIEREKIELLKLKQERQRLERERARFEREKLEREKEELERLKRQTLSQLEEERRKRSLSSSRDREYESSRKRTATEVRYESNHSRYPDRDYKKENSHKSADISNSRRAYETDTRARAWEETAVTVREEWPKERDSARYIERSGSSYRPQEESRSKSERHGRERYQDSSKGDRYSERPVDSWHGSSVGGMKSFSGGGSGRETWVSGAPDRSKVDNHSSQSWPRPPGNSNRWSGGPMNNRGPQTGPMFPQNMESGIPGMGMMSMGPYSSSGTNRFDSYKLPY